MRQRSLWAAALVMGVFVLAAGAADDKKEGAGDADAKALQGTWQCVSSVMDGDKQPDDEVRPYQLMVSGDKLTITKSGSTVIKGTLVLEAAQSPRHLDLKIEEDANNQDNAGKTMAGIYELKDEELKWCFTLPDRTERPKEFKSESGSSQIFATFKREKK